MKISGQNVKYRARLAGFGAHRGGSIAVLGAFTLPLVVMMVLCLLDLGRALSVKEKLQESLDAATLLAARSTAQTSADLQTVGAAALNSEFGGLTGIRPTGISFTAGANATVVGAVQANVPTTILGMFAANSIAVNANATVSRAMDYIELAMVLDNTGSMTDTLGSGSTTKIAALKTAANAMVDQLSTAASNSGVAGIVKISVVPYTMTVNVGAAYQTATWMSPGLPAAYGADLFATAGTNRFTLFSQMGVAWGGCVESRPSPYDVTESAPTTTSPGTLYVPYFAPDEPGSTSGGSTWNGQTWYNNYLKDVSTSTTWSVLQGYVAKYNTRTVINAGTSPIGYQYGPNAGCQVQPLTRMTTNFTAVKAAINAMTVGGDTDIKAGLMWGWHTLSPNAPFNDGTAYGTPNHDKVMVLMTDGQNHNVVVANNNASVYSGDGYIWQNRLGITSGSLSQRITALDAKLGQACANAKAAGIILYVVVLVDATVDQSTVEACASSSSQLYMVTDTSQLTGVFNNIAGAIQKLRITH